MNRRAEERLHLRERDIDLRKQIAGWRVRRRCSRSVANSIVCTDEPIPSTIEGWTPQTPWGALLHARGLMELIGRKISVCDAAENLSVFRLQEAFHPIYRRHFVQISISAAGVNSAGDYSGDGAGLPAHFLCRRAADASGCPLREPCHPRHRKRGDQE